MKEVFSVVCFSFSVFAFFYLIVTSNEVIVQRDAVTKECINVHPKHYSCDNLPEKYTVEYVAPQWMRK